MLLQKHIYLHLILASSLLAGTYSGGSGTSGAPYQISTTADLIELSLTPGDWTGKYFIQMNSITFNSDETQVDWDDDGSATWDAGDLTGFSPIGLNSTFTGIYDGNGKTINYLYIDRGLTNGVGLFSQIGSNTEIRDLGLLNVYMRGYNYVGGFSGYTGVSETSSSIHGCYVTGEIHGDIGIGGLVGQHGGTSTIHDSYSNVTVTCKNYAYSSVGGLVGLNDATITNSFATGTVNGNGANDVGGLVGRNTGTITNCYASGMVNGGNYADSYQYVGGLVGYHRLSGSIANSFAVGAVSGTAQCGGFAGTLQGDGSISNCYSRGDVTRNSGTNQDFGGFCGYVSNTVTIQYSYSTGNVFSSSGNAWGSGDGYAADQGFVGTFNSGSMTSNFFDNEASNQTSDGAGAATAKTTAQMTTDALVYNYTTNIYLAGGWDFKGESTNGSDEVWNIGNSRNDGYPYMVWRFPEDDVSLPVTLSDFKAKSENGYVQLAWSTSSEIENLEFILERAVTKNGPYKEIASYLTHEALNGHGSTSHQHDYDVADFDVEAGKTYFYRLSDVAYDGKVTQHPTVQVHMSSKADLVIPKVYKLEPAYPNPFNPSTTIHFELYDHTFVKLNVYDLKGRNVAQLIQEHLGPGHHNAEWRPAELPGGIYILRFECNSESAVQKLTILN